MDIMADKYNALWVSHSSINDFLQCPRAYFLKNMYKDPTNNKKVKLISPSLTLGSVVHTVLESLSTLPTEDRFSTPLLRQFDSEWEKNTGKKGGFKDEQQETKYKKRGEEMIRRVIAHPGPLEKLAVKINMDLPYYWLSEKDEIILCGKIDWLQYIPEEDSVNILDFKTSMKKEEGESLQLPIYHLLVHHCQKRKVKMATYWYLELDDEPEEKQLPDLDESEVKVMTIAKKIKLARQLNKLDCPEGGDGCFACRPFEAILRGEAENVGVDDYGTNIYYLPYESEVEEDREGILL